jgi:hypothetical protein
MSEIDDLINRAKSLVGSQKSTRVSKKGRSDGDVFIYQNRPVHSTNWATERDVTFISIYLPSQLPRIGFPHKSIVLHSHTVFQPCLRNLYCHVYGWNIPDRHLRAFNLVWSYLYFADDATYPKLGVDLSYD